MKKPFSLIQGLEAQREQDLSRITLLEVLPIALLSSLLWLWASIAELCEHITIVNTAAFSLPANCTGDWVAQVGH